MPTMKQKIKDTHLAFVAHQKFVKDNLRITKEITYKDNHIYLSKSAFERLMKTAQEKWDD